MNLIIVMLAERALLAFKALEDTNGWCCSLFRIDRLGKSQL